VWGLLFPFTVWGYPSQPPDPGGRGKGEAGNAGPARHRALDPCGGRR